MTGLELLVIGALGATALSTGVQAVSSLQQGKAASQAARTNATLAQQDAEAQAKLADREAQGLTNQLDLERSSQAFDESTLRRRNRRLGKTQRALVGVSGLEFSGSPLLVAIDSAREAELDIEASRFDSDLRQAELRDQASLNSFQGRELRRTGRNALRVGAFQSRQARRAGSMGAIGAVAQGGAQATSILLKAKK